MTLFLELGLTKLLASKDAFCYQLHEITRASSRVCQIRLHRVHASPTPRCYCSVNGARWLLLPQAIGIEDILIVVRSAKVCNLIVQGAFAKA